MILPQTLLAADAPSKPRATRLRAVWAGWAASVPAALLATAAVLAAPHVRGIGFFPALRFAVLTPACVLVAIGAAVLYRTLVVRAARPRAALAGALFAFAGLALIAMAVAGPPGLASTAAPMAVVVAALLSVLVPRNLERTRRSRVGSAAIVLFGALEIAGVYSALASERDASATTLSGVPRAIWDVDHRFVELPSGARIHYVDEGRGDVVLFLHGNPSWSFQWRELVKGLRASHRCIALDYPGFGFSEAPPGFGFTARDESHVVEEFIDRLGLRDITLVMQDWGGPIGLGVAGRRPDLVRRVVLGSTWAWPTTTAEPRGKFSVVAGGPVGEFAQVNFNAFAKLGIQNGVVHGLSPDVLDVYLRPFRPLAHRGIAAFYPGQITAATDSFEEVAAGLPRLADKPALIFWALKDVGFPRRDLERFEAAFPHHETVELPDANHFFFEDVADVMIPKIDAFLRSSP